MKFTPANSFKTWGVASAILLACMGVSANTITLTNPSGTQLGNATFLNNFNGGTPLCSD